MPRRPFPLDVSGAEWALLVPPAPLDGRPVNVARHIGDASRSPAVAPVSADSGPIPADKPDGD